MTSSHESVPGRARLRAVAGCVPPRSRVVDVGSDHGLLPRLLLAEDRAASCIATERRPGGALGELDGIDPRLSLRFGDGLAALEPGDPCDVVVIGGMGARSIVGILERGRARLERVARLVLQPQSEWPRLRRWLSANGFALADERLVAERGRHYLVLVAEPGGATRPSCPGLTDDDLLEAGPVLIRRRSVVAVDYWRDRERRARRAARGDLRTDERARARLEARVQQARRILAALGAAPPGV